MVSLCSLAPMSLGQAQTHLPGVVLLVVLRSFVSILLASVARDFLSSILTSHLLCAINSFNFHVIFTSVLGGNCPSNITAAYKAFAAAGSSAGSEHSEQTRDSSSATCVLSALRLAQCPLLPLLPRGQEVQAVTVNISWCGWSLSSIDC